MWTQREFPNKPDSLPYAIARIEELELTDLPEFNKRIAMDHLVLNLEHVVFAV